MNTIDDTAAAVKAISSVRCATYSSVPATGGATDRDLVAVGECHVVAHVEGRAMRHAQMIDLTGA